MRKTKTEIISDLKPTCPKCGGTIHFATCRLCELFEAGELTQPPVEKERLNNPKASDAMAVHPRQVPEAIESAKKKGVPTEFLKDGRPLFTSRRHQAAYIRAYGFFNKDACYGD